eukprot:7161491-Prymnesium_polylepis.2
MSHPAIQAAHAEAVGARLSIRAWTADTNVNYVGAADAADDAVLACRQAIGGAMALTNGAAAAAAAALVVVAPLAAGSALDVHLAALAAVAAAAASIVVIVAVIAAAAAALAAAAATAAVAIVAIACAASALFEILPPCARNDAQVVWCSPALVVAVLFLGERGRELSSGAISEF